MNKFTRKSLVEEGFRGFVRFADLHRTDVPRSPGVYVVTRDATEPPVWLERSDAGRFKQKDPSVPTSKLAERWIAGCPTLYIGKATNLRTRLKQFRDFGMGKPVGHWGGRYIWQVDGAHELLACWRPTLLDPRIEEKALFARFQDDFGRLPFANLVA